MKFWDSTITLSLKALELTWVRKLRDDNHHPWKIIPSIYLSLPNGESIFIRNFECNSDLIKNVDSLPYFYKELTSYWSEASYSTMTHVEILNNSDLIKNFDSLPYFYKELTSYWSETSYSTMNHVEILLFESLWYNTNLKINNNTVLYKVFALAGINQVFHLFDKFGKLIKFNDLVDKTGLSPSLFFLNGCSSLMHYQLIGNNP